MTHHDTNDATPTPSDERARIQALLDSGQISPDDAELLLSTLDELDDADASFGAGTDTGHDADSDAGHDAPASAAGTTRSQDADASDSRRATGRRSRSGPAELRWMHVELLAGSLTFHVDPALDRPTLEGDTGEADVRLDERGNDWSLRVRPQRKGNWLESMIHTTSGPNLRVGLPSGFGIDIDGKAGALSLDDVPYLRGSFMAGSVSGRNVGGLDLDMKAGTLGLTLRLDRGEHRLAMKAGSAELLLLEGSSVRVTGDMTAGGADLPRGFTQQMRFASSTFGGTVGSGDATLTITQKAGSLELEVEGE